jgi:DNA helicase MCM8
MVRDGGGGASAAGGDYSLDAGALVLADQGVCCIDEFDKMVGGEHTAMLEVMEQQSISMAKANMVCRLAARTSVVAAANPVGGHYDRSKTLSENVRLAAPLLSRFDLVFILLDRPDQLQDARLSEHVVRQHARRAGGSGSGSTMKSRNSATGIGDDGILLTPPNLAAVGAEATDSPSSRAAARPLASKLRVRPNDRECLWRPSPGDRDMELDLLPVPALRKYFAYARKYCRPLLSAGARAKLHAFFLHLRRLSALSPTESTPVTVRQLEALVRMAEARARAELQELVTPQHAQDVIDLMRESRAGLDAWAAADSSAAGGDEHGYGGGCASGLEADMALAQSLLPSTGKGVRAGSKAALKRQFLALLRSKAQARGGDGDASVFTAAELYATHEAAGLRRHVDNFDAFIDALNTENCLLRFGNKKYKLVM